MRVLVNDNFKKKKLEKIENNFLWKFFIFIFVTKSKKKLNIIKIN